MDNENAEQQHRVDPVAAAAQVSATEQLAKLTLDALPIWMKAPGGIRRFRLILFIVLVTCAIILGALIYRQASEVDAAILAPHQAS